MKKIVFLLLATFIFGWMGSSIYSGSYNTKDAETEVLSLGKNVQQNLDADLKYFEKLESAASLDNDKPSPSNRIDRDNILVYDDEVVIKIDNPQWAIFTDTNSMDPVIDSTSKAIQVIPKSEKELRAGDIVAYESKYKEGVVAHRIMETGYDKDGWYAILKGDNNDYADPGKVRFSQIKRVVVAIIY